MRHLSVVATAAVVSFFPLAANADSVGLSLGTSVEASVAGVEASVGVSGGGQAGGASVGGTAGADVTASISGPADASAGANVGANVGGSGGGSAGANVAAANAGASGPSTVNANVVLSAFGSIDAAAEAVAELDSESVVRVVPIGVMLSADPGAFANVTTAKAGATADLQAAIKANADFAAQLAGSGISVDSVVAGNVNADGSLVLYTKS